MLPLDLANPLHNWILLVTVQHLCTEMCSGSDLSSGSAAFACGNMHWFRGGLRFEAHRLLHHSA